MPTKITTHPLIDSCWEVEEPAAWNEAGTVYASTLALSGIDGKQMMRAGECVAADFPGYIVWVNAHPYRSYDVSYTANHEAKVIALDFYSVRPGLRQIPEVIREIKKSMTPDTAKPESIEIDVTLVQTETGWTIPAKLTLAHTSVQDGLPVLITRQGRAWSKHAWTAHDLTHTGAAIQVPPESLAAVNHFPAWARLVTGGGE